MSERYAWPLFGVAKLPETPAEIPAIARRFFGCGARYLGDESDFLGPSAPPANWIEMPVVGRSNVGKSSLLNALLGSADQSFVRVSRQPGSTRHLDFYAVGTQNAQWKPTLEADDSEMGGRGGLSLAEAELREQMIRDASLGGAAPRKPPTASAPDSGAPADAPPKRKGGKHGDDKPRGVNRFAGDAGAAAMAMLHGGHSMQPFQVPTRAQVKADFVLVDSPGYGYNVRGKHAEEQWLALIRSYLTFRSPVVVPRVMALVDARVGLTDLDESVLRMLDSVSVPYHIVLTKADAVTPAQLEARVEAVARAAAALAMPYPVINAISAQTGAGMPELREQIVLSTKLHRKLLGRRGGGLG